MHNPRTSISLVLFPETVFPVPFSTRLLRRTNESLTACDDPLRLLYLSYGLQLHSGTPSHVSLTLQYPDMAGVSKSRLSQRTPLSVRQSVTKSGGLTARGRPPPYKGQQKRKSARMVTLRRAERCEGRWEMRIDDVVCSKLRAPESRRRKGGNVGSTLRVALVSLANSGTTTLFNALTKRERSATAFLGETRSTASARVDVASHEFDTLCGAYDPKVRTPLKIIFADVPGIIDELTDFTADVVTVVVRSFQGDATHPQGSVDPRRDIQIVGRAMRRHDLGVLRRELDEKNSAGTWGELREDVLKRTIAWLEEDRPLSEGQWNDRELSLLGSLRLVSDKPVVVVVNGPERQLKLALNLSSSEVPEDVLLRGSGIDEAAQKTFGPEVRILSSCACAATTREIRRDALLMAPLKALDMITVYTCSEDEVRAWVIPDGTTVKEFARGIHEYIGRYFIMAEIIDFPAFHHCPSEAELRRRNDVRRCGPEVILDDNQLIFLKFKAN